MQRGQSSDLGLTLAGTLLKAEVMVTSSVDHTLLKGNLQKTVKINKDHSNENFKRMLFRVCNRKVNITCKWQRFKNKQENVKP